MQKPRKGLLHYNKDMNFKRAIIILITLVVFVVYLDFESEKMRFSELKIGETAIQVEIVDTSSARTKGLSGRKSLLLNSGMFFVFDSEEIYGIWMKDMNFPIDIIWLDENLKIVHIEEEVSPETYPKIFYSTTPVLYVLEVNQGFVKEREINIGDEAVLIKKQS